MAALRGGLFFVLWIAFFGVSPAKAETLTIGTYNVENYGLANRMTEVGYRQDYPKPEREKQALRQVIRALNADVLALQEVGSEAYLAELQRDLKAEGCDYPFTALAKAADQDRHVAVLSRRPLTSIVTYADLSFTYFGKPEAVKRGVLQVTVATAAGEVTLFAVHLKSRFTDRPDDLQSAARREGEATAIRDLILRRFPSPVESKFIILGDCNDSPVSKPVERLRHRGETPVGVLLPVSDSRGETWTYCYRKEDAYSRVDHILVSPGLINQVSGRRGQIYDGEGTRDGSDHRAVVTRFEFAAH